MSRRPKDPLNARNHALTAPISSQSWRTGAPQAPHVNDRPKPPLPRPRHATPGNIRVWTHPALPARTATDAAKGRGSPSPSPPCSAPPQRRLAHARGPSRPHRQPRRDDLTADLHGRRQGGRTVPDRQGMDLLAGQRAQVGCPCLTGCSASCAQGRPKRSPVPRPGRDCDGPPPEAIPPAEGAGTASTADRSHEALYAEGRVPLLGCPNRPPAPPGRAGPARYPTRRRVRAPYRLTLSLLNVQAPVRLAVRRGARESWAVARGTPRG